jgi:hypothetical protein
LSEPAVSRLEFVRRRVTLALRFRGGTCEFRILALGLAKLSLEVLDPPSQELPLLGNASKLSLGGLERAGSSFHVGSGRLHHLGSAARRGDRRIRLGPCAGTGSG